MIKIKEEFDKYNEMIISTYEENEKNDDGNMSYTSKTLALVSRDSDDTLPGGGGEDLDFTRFEFDWIIKLDICHCGFIVMSNTLKWTQYTINKFVIITWPKSTSPLKVKGRNFKISGII